MHSPVNEAEAIESRRESARLQSRATALEKPGEKAREGERDDGQVQKCDRRQNPEVDLATQSTLLGLVDVEQRLAILDVGRSVTMEGDFLDCARSAQVGQSASATSRHTRIKGCTHCCGWTPSPCRTTSVGPWRRRSSGVGGRCEGVERLEGST